MPDDPKKVAWIVEVNDFTCVVFATTRPKARWIAVAGHRDAGYSRRGEWPSTYVRRAAHYDRCVLRDRGPVPWTETHVMEVM